MRQACGNSPKPRPDGFDGKLEEINGAGGKQQGNNRSGYARRQGAADDQGQEGKGGERGGLKGQGMKVAGERFQAKPEHAWDFVEVKSEEILDLRAGDQHGNSVGESDHD